MRCGDEKGSADTHGRGHRRIQPSCITRPDPTRLFIFGSDLDCLAVPSLNYLVQQATAAGVLLRRVLPRWRPSFAQHLGHEEDNDRSEKTATPEEVHHGVTGGGHHRLNYQCHYDHTTFLPRRACPPSRWHYKRAARAALWGVSLPGQPAGLGWHPQQSRPDPAGAFVPEERTGAGRGVLATAEVQLARAEG